MSVFESFFDGQARGEFALHNWGMVLGLLSHITFRKCLNRNRDRTAKKRDETRTVPFEEWQRAAGGPLPEDEAGLAELLAQALAGFDAEEREVIEAYLEGSTTEAVADRVGFSQRTVQRILERFRTRLTAMLEVE